MEMLDELTLEHMTQDCSLLKNQLLRLKTLLQVRETQPCVLAQNRRDPKTIKTPGLI